ncbi:metal-dependent hydrolase [Aminobacter carboxidus]|uniref:Metal-dependent hydrolase n=1 Tax=Aminobacter carboxidus TaxID=376165 RepID=A0ABR9GJT4_9HYPH|nr:metal-dependent hydrolase [Aminobacter carboxidus]MBE1203917.1 metal-dependent hydrolase [Aminobacter carboxidus]
MLIAHLPAGFVLGTLVRDLGRGARTIMPAALLGSVAPDLDMFYFYLIDGQQTHHHSYFTHWPLFWTGLGVVALPLVKWLWPQLFAAAMVFFTAVMTHMVLDSIATPMQWLMPFSDVTVELVTIPARYSHWVLSFILHWTFALELVICAWAALLAVRQLRQRKLRESRA